MTRYRLLSLASVLFFSFGLVCAQEEESANLVEDFTPANHIRTGLRFKNYKVNFSTDAGAIFDFTNIGLNTFIGGRYGKIGLSLSLPLKSIGVPANEQSKRIGFNLHLYQPHWYLHLTAQSLEGFTEASLNTETPDSFRPDIRFRRVGLYGFWVSNSDLSLRASFRHSQRQLKSQGSWLLASTINSHRLLTDSITIPLSSEASFSFKRFQQLKLGIGGGYAFTWVFASKCYITPVLVAGPELRIQHYQAIDDEKTQDRLNISPRIRGRLALGYNGDRYFSSITGYWLPAYDIKNQFNTRVQDLQLSFTFGYRLAGKRKT